LFIIDNFTGWLELFPLRAATGAATVKAFTGYCHRFDVPYIIHSDRGLHFHNTAVLAWAEKLGIKWVFGSPGVAKTQGKAERAIRTVKNSIHRLAEENPKA
jgi:transposase InsO family protein